jgi:hypothetical protein
MLNNEFVVQASLLLDLNSVVAVHLTGFNLPHYEGDGSRSQWPRGVRHEMSSPA